MPIFAFRAVSPLVVDAGDARGRAVGLADVRSTTKSPCIGHVDVPPERDLLGGFRLLAL